MLSMLEGRSGIEIVPTFAAWAVSGGPVATADLDRLIDEFVASVRDHVDVDGACISFHGAMAGEEEVDPEGRALAAVREILGDIPIAVSIDLHAVITDRLVDHADVLVPFHTYPHTDQYETGQRAARNLLGLLDGTSFPTTVRVKLPMLVRGDELLTATGLFGQAIGICKEIEASDRGLAAGVIIGNPFTDVPDLRSNVLVTTNGDPKSARENTERLARFMWENRQRLLADLIPLDESIRLAEETDGLTVFSDAADSTASGAPGDSNAILGGILESGYSGKALIPIVDAPAAATAFDAGVGATLTLPLGGTLDPGRHTPLDVEVRVKGLFDGNFAYEDGTTARAGRTAVLVSGNHQILVTERSVYVVGRKVYLAHGLDPRDFDVVVAKSPNGFRTHYESIAARIVPVDVPGSTSANLASLPFQNCARPVFPLDDNVPPPECLAS
jgi:microcystin degradation protein MlrC